MNFVIIENFKVKTSEGEMLLQAGQTITLQSKKAVELIEAGKIAEICYWQDMVIPGCQKPCYHSDRSGNISECPHFRAYWAVRLTNINSKTVIQASDGDNAVT